MPSLNTGNAILSNAITVDSSYNVGIGGAADATYKLKVTGIAASNSIYANGDGAFTGGGLFLKQYASAATNITGYNIISTQTSGFLFSASVASSFKNFILDASSLTDVTQRTYTLPNASGTIALLSGTQTFTGATTFSSSVTANKFISNATDDGIGQYFWFTGNAAVSNNFSVYAYSNNVYINAYQNMVIRANQGTTGGSIQLSGGNVGIGTTTTTNGLLSLRANTNDTIALVFQPTGSQAPSAISNFLGTNQTFTVLGSNAYVTSSGNIARFNTSYAGCFIALDEGDIGFSAGTNGANPSQRMRIIGAGAINITNAPANSWSLDVLANNTTGQSFGIKVRAGSNSSDSSFLVQNVGASTDYFRVRGDGYVQSATTYNNTTASGANLSISTSGFFERSTSSIKYKKDVINYDKGLAEVLQMRPVYYKGKGENDGDKQFSGLIAEEIHDLGLTEFVQYAEDGSPDALSYGNMIALAFKAIQELNQKVENQQQTINSLINR
jgi:hypothetical protein